MECHIRKNVRHFEYKGGLSSIHDWFETAFVETPAESSSSTSSQSNQSCSALCDMLATVELEEDSVCGDGAEGSIRDGRVWTAMQSCV